MAVVARLAPMTALLLLTGCMRWLPSPTPMRSLRYELAQGPARCLVVFLPGAGDTAEEFERNGFVAEVKKRPLSVDMVAANSTMGYYFKGLMVDRVSTDVVEPLLTRGYEQVWLVGMSMGGMGTFLYSHERPAHVTGILSLAPYMGPRSVTDPIRAAGGLAAWQAPPKAPALTEDNYQHELWRWLQATATGKEKGPLMYLGWGTQDDLHHDNELLAALLPKEHVWTAEGGHDWPPWREILGKFLDDSDFSRACGQQR